MNPALPEWLNDELAAIKDESLRNNLTTSIESTVFQTVRDLLEHMTVIRYLLLYFNTHPDWDAVLEAIHDLMHVDGVQVVRLKDHNNLVYKSLPPDLPVEDDFASLLQETQIIDEYRPGGPVRLSAVLAVNDDVLGMILLIRETDTPFTDYDRIVLLNVASEMAVAFNNVDMYKMLADQAEQLAMLVRSAHRG